MNYLPSSVEDLFDRKEETYTYFSNESMDNFWSMDWFIKYFELQSCIVSNEGTQIQLTHPDYHYQLQIDAGGLGDFYSHKFAVIPIYSEMTINDKVQKLKNSFTVECVPLFMSDRFTKEEIEQIHKESNAHPSHWSHLTRV